MSFLSDLKNALLGSSKDLFKRVDMVNTQYFELLVREMDKHLNFKEISRERIFWKDIEQAKFDLKSLSLQLKVRNKRSPIKLNPSTHGGVYQLLKAVPAFIDFNHKDVIELFRQMQGCKVCGSMAVYQELCQCCLSESWNEELRDEYDNEESYIKECQIDIFEVDEDEEIDLNYDEDHIFKKDSSWKLLVAEEELRIKD